MQDGAPTSGRRLRRFITSQVLNAPSSVQISKEETRHLRKILRLKVKDSCLVTDGKGLEAEAKILCFNADGTAFLEIFRLNSSANR